MAFVLRFGWTKGNMEDMPKPKAEGWKISREKVWGANAKRSASALFSGKLVAKKVTLDMAFPANLTPAEIKKLMKYADPNDLSNKYCYIQFTNEKNEVETKRFYFGNPSFDAMSYINGKHNFSPVFFYSLLRTCSLKYSLSSQVRTLVSLSSPCLIYNLHCSIQKNIPECIDKIEKNENIE